MTNRSLIRRVVLCALLGAATTALAQEKVSATLEVISIRDGATRQIAQLTGDDRFPVWSPDSRRVALRTVRAGVTGIAIDPISWTPYSP
jgi:Tol biopolymer transport system component